MHFEESCYVGLSRLAADRVNVCGLFRRRPADPPLPAEFRDRICGDRTSLLTARLEQAVWDKDSCCSVAAVPVQPLDKPQAGVLRLGDALGIVPPFTGNGMSMAFESARLAAPFLAEAWPSDRAWDAACRSFSAAARRAFKRRLACSSFLHSALFRPPVRQWLVMPLLKHGPVWRALFHLTR
jgi:2-polyprenyl-6-methoxyphenol hydroxylase-like FAD-dependent oxidoreductase